MMHGHEIAVKPANKVERSAAEPVERRVETKGNVGQLAQMLCSCSKLSLDPRFSALQAVSANAPACPNERRGK
jgi:hypothetical protein